MARQPVQSIPLSAELRPVAQTVDTYVKPAQSPMREFVNSIARFDPELQKMVATRDQKAERDAATRGKAAFYQNGQADFAQMVTEGKIPAQSSPFYVRAYKQAQGEAAGSTLRQNYQDWWDNWGGKDSDDPKAFDAGFQEFLKGQLKTEDPDVLRGVLPAVEALQQNATTQYTDYRHTKTVNGNLNANGALINSGVQDALDAGLLEPKGADYEAIFSGVNAQVAKGMANGDAGDKAKNLFIDVMSAKIMETRDPALMKWFDTKVPGQDYTWGQTPHGLEVKNSTLNHLETLANRQQADLDARQRAEQKKLKDQAEAAIINGLFANPSAPFDQKMLEQAEKNGNPQIKVDAIGWRDSVLKGTPSDPAAIKGFYSKIISGEASPQAVMRDALSNGVFQNGDDLKAAQSFVQSFQGQQDTIEKAQGSVNFKNILEAIRVRTTNVDPTTYNPIAGWSNEGFKASSDFRELVTRWIIKHPNATTMEINEQISRFGKSITDNITAAETFGEPGTYRREAGLPFDNAWQYPRGQNQKQPTPNVKEGVLPNADVRDWEKAQKVTPEQKAIFEQLAERRGMTYEEFIRSRAMKAKP